jgi:hypothetical protein
VKKNETYGGIITQQKKNGHEKLRFLGTEIKNEIAIKKNKGSPESTVTQNLVQKRSEMNKNIICT